MAPYQLALWTTTLKLLTWQKYHKIWPQFYHSKLYKQLELYCQKSTKTNLSNLTRYNLKVMLTRNLINHY